VSVVAVYISITLIYLAGGVLLFWMAWITWQMRAHGAAFWPTSKNKLEHMFKLAKITSADHVADLGSGDGRIIFRAAECGAARAVGYEIDPYWYNMSMKKHRASPYVEKIQFFKKSFWEADFSSFTVVFLYQGKHILKDLVKKLQNELPNGARVISNAFCLPNWEPEAELEKVFLYVIKK
jgi:cyclopropane fatty-acyl-phospholipid synthase-like methyltransferase